MYIVMGNGCNWFTLGWPQHLENIMTIHGLQRHLKLSTILSLLRCLARLMRPTPRGSCVVKFVLKGLLW